MTVNLRHERVALGDLARFVLPLLDGSRDADAIAGAIAHGGLASTPDSAAVASASRRSIEDRSRQPRCAAAGARARGSVDWVIPEMHTVRL
jgi:hypothetical protein